MLSARIQDVSGFTYVSFPRELGDSIMNNVSAKDFMDMKETKSPEEMKTFF
jgi:Fe-S cluster biosynthesis and repair protein YggX